MINDDDDDAVYFDMTIADAVVADGREGDVVEVFAPSPSTTPLDSSKTGEYSLSSIVEALSPINSRWRPTRRSRWVTCSKPQLSAHATASLACRYQRLPPPSPTS